MVESHFDNNKQEIEYLAVNNNISETQGSPLERDPSFSRWCDEDGRVHFEHGLENLDASVEDSDFELPLLHQAKIENTNIIQYSNKFHNASMHLNGGNTMDHENNIHNRGNEKEKYVPFDIENGSSREIHVLNSGVDGSSYAGNREMLPPKSKNPVSAADVLKTLFFILVWYTFSTFLTL